MRFELFLFIYTWEEWKCPESIWEGSEDYCVFHDPSPKRILNYLNLPLIS
jgi:hypothetical protein